MILFRCLGSTLRGTRYAPATPGRFAVVLPLLAGIGVLALVHRLFLGLDWLLYPGWRRVEISEPLFLVGVPRSGTTLFHRVLSEDRDRFTSMKLWEILFAPAVSERRLLEGLARLDAAVGGPLRAGVTRFDRWWFEGVRGIHPTSLFAPEEDDLTLTFSFSTAFLFFCFPLKDPFLELGHFDERVPVRRRRRIMKRYQSYVRRHLYARGPERRFLSKNPAFTGKLDSLREFFPDASVVACHREPEEAVPSLLSLLWYPWRLFRNAEDRAGYADLVVGLMRHWYGCLREDLARWPSAQRKLVHYADLASSPETVVRELYDQQGWKISAGFAESLRRQEERARRYRSDHVYDLGDWGLDAEMLRERLGLPENDLAEGDGLDESPSGRARGRDIGPRFRA